MEGEQRLSGLYKLCIRSSSLTTQWDQMWVKGRSWGTTVQTCTGFVDMIVFSIAADGFCGRINILQVLDSKCLLCGHFVASQDMLLTFMANWNCGRSWLFYMHFIYNRHVAT